jgi:cytochrome c-type biogenesis protein CcmH/NrfF
MIYTKCKTNLWRAVLALTLVIYIVSTSSAQDIGDNQNDHYKDLRYITTKIYCPCGCGYVLASCDCETAVATVEDIIKKLESGENPDQILMGLVSLHGPSILVKNDKRTYSERTNNVDMFPFYLIGIGGAVFVAYKLGQKKSDRRNWKVRKKRK